MLKYSSEPVQRYYEIRDGWRSFFPEDYEFCAIESRELDVDRAKFTVEEESEELLAVRDLMVTLTMRLTIDGCIMYLFLSPDCLYLHRPHKFKDLHLIEVSRRSDQRFE